MQPDIPQGLDENMIERVIQDALDEDLGLGGDITSYATIDEYAKFSGVFCAREQMTIAGIDIAGRVFFALSDDITWESLVSDGERVEPGTTLARINGSARALLAGERTALNLLQHLCGIATTTAKYVDAISDSGAVILDTRKTIPGLRDLAKYATRTGGATNHRMRLDDGVLIKDNHIIAAGGIEAAVKSALEQNLKPIEVECDTIDQVKQALDAGAHAILLDNMDTAMIAKAVKIIGSKARTEASGGVNLENVKEIAKTGVDGISIGRLTQSAPAVDIGLDWQTD